MPFKIIRNDITKVRASAIVNTANPMPVIGSGTDSAIYEAAGEERLLAARKKIGTIEPGKAAITRGYGLPAAYIIHTVGPVWEGGGKQETAIGVFTEFLADHEMEILLVVFDKDSLALSENLVGAIDSYIDERYAGVQARREYSSPFRERVFESSELHDFSAGGAIYKDDTWQSYSASLNAPDEDSFIFDDLLEEESSPEDFRLSEEREVSRPKPFPALSAPRRPEPDSAPVPDRASRPKASESGAFRRTEKRRRTLDGLADQLGESFQKMLFRLIDEKNMTDVEVYKRANIDKRLFSKIRSNSRYQPRKSTALALAIALRLNLDETKDLLSRAGYALSPSSLSDLIVSFFIENEIWDVITIDIALFEHDETPLTG